jgi:hypothetical protein
MLEARNKTSHTYDDIQVTKVVRQIGNDFLPALQTMQVDFTKRLTS